MLERYIKRRVCCNRLPIKGERLIHDKQFWKSNVIEGSFEYSLICRNYFTLVICHNTWRNHTKVIWKLHCLDYKVDVRRARGLHAYFLAAKVICNGFSPGIWRSDSEATDIYNSTNIDVKASDKVASTSVLNARPVRQVYLITYSQVDLHKFPDRNSIVQAVLRSFDSSNTNVEHWFCCEEVHESTGGHQYHMAVKLQRCKRWLSSKTVACLSSVSLQFRNKEGGTRVKDLAKNGAGKRAGRGWGRKEGNACRQTSGFWPPPPPTHTHTWPFMPQSCTDIWCCHQLSFLTNKIFALPWSGSWTLEDAFVKPK